MLAAPWSDRSRPVAAAAPPAGRRRRWIIAIATSLLGHGAVLLAGAGSWLQPSPPLSAPVWLDLDNRLGAPSAAVAAPVAAPAPPAPAPPSSVGAIAPAVPDRAARPRTHRRRARRRSPGPSPAPSPAPALAEVGPGDAALLVLLRCDQIRDSPFADATRELLSAFYDFRALLAGSGLDPLRDFDRLLIATPNPYRITETLLVARHALAPGAARTALDAGVQAAAGGVRWTPTAAGWQGEVSSPPRLPGDPRRLALEDHLLVFAAPGLIDQLWRPVAPPVTAPAESRTSPPPPRPWVELLLEGGLAAPNASAAHAEAGLLVRAINLPRLIRLPPGLPMPLAAQVNVPVSEPTRVVAVLSFTDAADAASALRALQLELARLQSLLVLRVLGVGALLDRLELRRRGAELRAGLVLDRAEVVQLLGWFRSSLPQARAPAPASPAPPAGP